MNTIRDISIAISRGLTISLMLLPVVFVLIRGIAGPAPMGTDEQVMSIRPATPGSQADVIEKAGCVEATGGVLPESAVVDPRGPRSWTHVASQKGLGEVFEQAVFDGTMKETAWVKPVDHGMRIGIYCR